MMTSQQWHNVSTGDPLNQWIQRGLSYFCHVVQQNNHYLLYLMKHNHEWQLTALSDCISVNHLNKMTHLKWSVDLFSLGNRPAENAGMSEVFDIAITVWNKYGYIPESTSETNG